MGWFDHWFDHWLEDEASYESRRADQLQERLTDVIKMADKFLLAEQRFGLCKLDPVSTIKAIRDRARG